MISSTQSHRTPAASPCRQVFALAMAAAVPMFAASAVAFAQTGAYAITIEPEAPRAQQAVYAVVAMPGCRVPKDVRYVDGVFEIGVAATLCGVPPPGLYPRAVSLGKLPQGTYRLRIGAGANGQPPLQEYTLTVEPPVAGDWSDEHEPLLDYSGWWTTEDPTLGEGWLVEHKVPDRMMFSWVTYDDAGEPTWLVMQSTDRSHRALTGPVYRSERVDGSIVRTLVGEGRFEGYAPGEARFTLTPEDMVGESTVTELHRIRF